MNKMSRSNRFDFIKVAVQRPFLTGWFFPSHNRIKEAILSKIPDKQDVIFEAGTGSGEITRILSEKANHVISVEINPKMIELAKRDLKDYSNITIIQDDAQNILRYIREYTNGKGTSFIISSLPIHRLKNKISYLRDCYEGLCREGVFIQISFDFTLRSHIKKVFEDVDRELILGFPPISMFCATKYI